MTKYETIATRYWGKRAKLSDPSKAAKKAKIMTGFSENLSTRKPAGMDITPYAIKNAKAKNPAAVRLSWKLLMMSGTIGPRMLVSREITKKMIMISETM